MANVFEFCSSLIAASRVTEADESLSEAKNAKKKQNLMSGKADNDTGDEDDCLKKNKGVEDDVVASVRETLVCNICFCMSEKPVTATDLFVKTESPSWDFDMLVHALFLLLHGMIYHLVPAEGRWKWIKSQPASRKSVEALCPLERKRIRKATKATRNSIGS
ncbi:hypothetical protein ARALYDRAFT_892504 [Arabidopsis lyrata subsp. lyrata]|uniref:Uncharacterized protein n=1 Tax=Arabidopsis lyrata subsp. lyrata TaxID=81972 RepID=D7KM62_ARALL|nr:hypothetical protein ARALYDRAFT_892504 [Arabidopsis lyrata subsp. lyrata]